MISAATIFVWFARFWVIASFLYAFYIKLQRLAMSSRTSKAQTKKHLPMPRMDSLTERFLNPTSEYHKSLSKTRRRFIDAFDTTGLPTKKQLAAWMYHDAQITCMVWAPAFCATIDIGKTGAYPHIRVGGVPLCDDHVVVVTKYQLRLDDNNKNNTEHELLCHFAGIDSGSGQKGEKRTTTFEFAENKVIVNISQRYQVGQQSHMNAFANKVTRTFKNWDRILVSVLQPIARFVHHCQGWQNIGITIKYNHLTIIAHSKCGAVSLVRLDDYSHPSDFQTTTSDQWKGLIIFNSDNVNQWIHIDSQYSSNFIDITHDITYDMQRFVVWCLEHLFKKDNFTIGGASLQAIWDAIPWSDDDTTMHKWHITSLDHKQHVTDIKHVSKCHDYRLAIASRTDPQPQVPQRQVEVADDCISRMQ